VRMSSITIVYTMDTARSAFVSVNLGMHSEINLFGIFHYNLVFFVNILTAGL